MTQEARVADINYEAGGKQTGFLRIPHSVHRSAYGWIPVPLVQIKNGSGPCVLVMAGVHGDEYEGQLAITKLIQKLSVHDVTGCLMFLPTSNYPAAVAGLRTSPLDEGNLNRLFPGDDNGSPTELIAHAIEHELMSRADVVIDLHSGGSSLNHLSTAFADPGSTAESRADAIRYLQALGLPYSSLYSREGFDNHTCGAGLRQGVLSLSAELGGAGTVTPSVQRLADAGLTRLLIELGVVRQDAFEIPEAEPTQLVETGANDLVYSFAEGVFESLIELGDNVSAGQTAGYIHTPETPWKEPSPVVIDQDGFVLVSRFPARVQRGDCLYQLARIC